jgi:copper chaperone NosL
MKTGLIIFCIGICFASCSTNTSPLQIGIDACENCKMTISDARFGAEIITYKGRIYKFDDIVCLRSFMKSGALKSSEIESTYLVDYCNPHLLNPISNCFLSASENYGSPMNGNIAAFADKDSAIKYNLQMEGDLVLWNKIE